VLFNFDFSLPQAGKNGGETRRDFFQEGSMLFV